MPPQPPDSSASADVFEANDRDENLTFGVELEFVFAFHESLLELGQTNGIIDDIKKDLSYFVRETGPFTVINQADLRHHAYNSWGIRRGGVSPPVPYAKEPQNILEPRLEHQCPNLWFEIHDTTTMDQKTTEKYDKWLLCKDHSVCGVGSRNIFPGRLAHRAHDNDPESWDSIGLEAVSQVYNSGSLSTGAADIKLVVNAVKGKDEYKYGSFITNRE